MPVTPSGQVPLPGPEPGPGQPPTSGGGLTEEQVRAMLEPYFKEGDSVALASSGDETTGHPQSYLCAEGGGPSQFRQEFHLTSRDAEADPAAWESWKLKRGQ